MTQTARIKQVAKKDLELATPGRKPPKRRAPSRYDILIHCRNEAQQRELFERLQQMGLSLRLLVL